MRRRSRFSSILRVSVFALVLFGAGFLTVFAYQNLKKNNDTQALSATEFQAGRIIDDSIFYNPNTMTAAEIDAFIDSHSPECDMWGNGRTNPMGIVNKEYARIQRENGSKAYHEPPYVCVSEFYENPETHKTNFDTNGKREAGMLSAGEIIYEAAQTYGINPQVLLVMLKKESYAWGDDWPLRWEYNTVMGYACPDGAPCNEDYFGFYNQMMTAAWQLNYYREHIYSYNYRPYATNNILYNPDRSCGSKQVYLENVATTSLYIYTPYVPNDAALRNYPGTSYCGSYGNRNFYMYFREWFGNALANTEKVSYPDGSYLIKSKNGLSLNSSGSAKGSFVSAEQNGTLMKLVKNTDGTYTLLTQDSELALDIPAAEVKPGVKLQLWTQNSSKAQKWYLMRSGTSLTLVSTLNQTFAISLDRDTGGAILEYYDSTNEDQLLLFNNDEQIISNGIYEIHSALDDNSVIDIANNSTANHANVQIYKANGTTAQKFKITYLEKNDTYSIVGISSNRALDAENEGKSNGTNVQIYEQHSSCAQEWKAIKVGEHITFLNLCSSKALDVSGGISQSGTNIQVYASNGTLAQKWTLKDASAKEEHAPNGTNDKPDTLNGDAQTINDGIYEIRSALDKNLAIDISNNSTANHANVQIYKANGTTAQKFKIKYNHETNTYSLVGLSSNRALDVENESKINGANIQIYEQNSSCAQKWTAKKSDDYVSFFNACSGKALDVSGGIARSGINVQLYASNETLAQKWILVE